MSLNPPVPESVRRREIFLAALEKPVAERKAFVSSECAGNPKLQAEIEELLGEQDTVGSFLETPALSNHRGISPAAFGPGGTVVVQTVTEKPGDRIGRYKLLQKIGEGGCGVVYMADQEEPVRRKVALKVIKLGMDTKNVITRFEAERQALAMMDHPNIARVLDAGATEKGRPYFVMELVRGVRITDYCDGNNLTTGNRLKLFIQVCHAIQHAHQKGIIHRDIKPSNILVTLHDGIPVPKVIDFGIAKATEQPLTDNTLFTEFNTFIGTPAYMSPEQAEMSGLDVDTRSDIYSLGVLLYELLVGQPPFDPDALLKGGLDECRRTIREREPVRPSNRLSTMNQAELTTTAQQRHTDPPRLIHSLRGDLDWIAMKCLEKDRTRRYSSASDLAADVQRFLDGEIVTARPPSQMYRLRKMARRHRGMVAAAAGLTVTLLVGGAVSTWQAVRATNAERMAQAATRAEKGLRQQAEGASASAQLNEYVADINLAQQSLTAGNYGRAVQLLNKHRRQPGQPDLRGFEWRYLWQQSRGDEHTAFHTFDGPVQAVAVAPAGNLLAIGGTDQMEVWNLAERRLLHKTKKAALSLAFLPDNLHLVAAGRGSVRVWNVDEWDEPRNLPGNAAPIALSPDGRTLATAERQFPREEIVRLWDTSDWKSQKTLSGASRPLAFSPDAKILASESKGLITLRPLTSGAKAVILEGSTNLFGGRGPFSRMDRGVAFSLDGNSRMDRGLAFSPDGKYVVGARNTLSEHGVFVLSVWDAASGEEEGTIPDDPEHIEHTGTICSLAFSPDGHTLATASMDYSIRLWDFNTRQRLATFQGHLSEVLSLAFTPDGQSLVSGAKDGEVRIWPIRPRQKEDTFAGVKQPLGFSRDGQTLAALNREGVMVFINLQTEQIQQQISLDHGRFRFGMFGTALSLSEDLSTLVQGRENGQVKIWNTTTGHTNLIKAAQNPIEQVALSPDGNWLVTRARDTGYRRWDLRTRDYKAWRVEAQKVLFSPDGTLIATYGRSNTVQLWDTATLTLRSTLTSEEAFAFPISATATPAAFSPDGQLFAIACQDDAIRIWEAASGKMIGTCAGHKQGIFSIAFSPDGRTLATDSDDSTLKLWNVATQQELLTMRRLGVALRALVFSKDGQVLAAGTSGSSPSGGLYFYRAPAVKD
ncbi:MAG: pknB 19 [Verrucomicrobiales bacterium]|nr:pknB 19 [Verrucomicrobiales bacterium]